MSCKCELESFFFGRFYRGVELSCGQLLLNPPREQKFMQKSLPAVSNQLFKFDGWDKLMVSAGCCHRLPRKFMYNSQMPCGAAAKFL